MKGTCFICGRPTYNRAWCGKCTLSLLTALVVVVGVLVGWFLV